MTREVNLLEQDIGRSVLDLHIPMLGELKSDMDSVLEQGKPLIKTIRYKDEWYLQRVMPFVSEKNTMEGVVVTLMRITDQKNAELAWEMQHNLLLTILEQSPAAILTVDHEGNINFANRNAEEILGIEKSRLLSMTIHSDTLKITDIEGRPIPREDQPLAQVLETKQPVEKYIMCIRTAQGKVVLNVNANPTFDKEKEVVGAVFRIDKVAYE